MNKCFFIGNVGKDPETRSLSSGDEMANLTLAVSEKWKDANGEKHERTEWVKVSVFSKGLVQVIKNWVKKGDKLMVEGKMQTRKWQDKDGIDRYSTEIVLSGLSGSIELLGGAKKADTGQKTQSTSTEVTEDFTDCDIPF